MKHLEKTRPVAHYRRIAKIRIAKLKKSFVERFWQNMSIRGTNECWNWFGKLVKGYGTFSNQSGSTAISSTSAHLASHRIAWELTNGPIPKGIYVCHKCDNRKCCNPAHLFLGTHMDNMIDRQAKGRTASGNKTKWFGKYGTKSVLHKLTEEQVIEIRKRHKQGDHNVTLAKHYKVTRQNIRAIIKRITWPHV